MNIKPLKTNKLPKALPFRKLLGPSFIILGLGLGSGELILWPYLTSNFGMGVIWGAIVGITFQFFMNMEIERYALARGESIFVGFARKLSWLPYWFVLSTALPWIWPGITSASATLLGTALNIDIANKTTLAMFLLVLMGIILSAGKTLYKTVENFQKLLISIGVPTVFGLAIILARTQDWVDLAKGVVGIGYNYYLLPMGVPIATFLGALAYAGAGGNLNLAQSFYVKAKGYGMGKYVKRIAGFLTGKPEDIDITGSKFDINEESVREFNKWWKNINVEHFTVFWLTGTITMVLLGLLAYTTTYGVKGTEAGINFVILESKVIGQRLGNVIGTFFILVAGLTLFGTQLTVFDATSRIITENILLIKNKLEKVNVSKIYYTVLWLQILVGILIFKAGLTEPLELITIAAVLNAFAMFVHSGLTLWTNLTLLDKELRPSKYRIGTMLLAFLFYGGFSFFVIISKLFM